jgi:NAD(P)-dependent dehydrogenase (short-subunit alcohol dehydrogenase family)
VGVAHGLGQQDPALEALEAAPCDVRVNAVAPGATQTDMLETVTGHDAEAKAGFLATVPLQRAAEPEEIADVIVYLAAGRAPRTWRWRGSPTACAGTSRRGRHCQE